MCVEIAIATFNGERYLSDQIQSILSQDYSDWRLLIRDDGSTDSTHKILQAFLQQEPRRLQWLNPVESQNIGVVCNFNRLLEYSSSNYTFLCDQDDVWLPSKIKDSLQIIKQMEYQWGVETPILVHSDLHVVTAKLQLFHASFWRSHNLDPTRNTLRDLLVRNNITGCTVVINKALRKLALPIPNSIFMHDWWLALVATAFGKIAWLSKPTILYRQHQRNQVSAQSQKLRYLVTRLQQPRRIREYYRKTQKQAQEFFNRYGSQLSAQDKEIVSAYCECENLGFCAKRQLLIRHKLFDIGLVRNLALLSLI
ncbi:glycosyltransferase family 2 protein [Acaryochloris sp. IP29b_bin.137]|uniref:glycosyltransferase family 2 protein n=1 Tax=Acaryochloris sp. IP29b_bin.137 TaxID=2969217 RepID=UPI00262E55A1|nr:glycosyltransferase family 2 protein [Acaryochloris sp. IP29b_bin.137]